MTGEWWSGVWSQVLAGVLVLGIGSLISGLSRAGRSFWKGVGSALSRLWRFLTSIRLTTESRIEARAKEAERTALAELEREARDLDVATGPFTDNDLHRGWLVRKAAQRRRWELVNQTGNAATVLFIVVIGPGFVIEEYPDLPVELADGAALLMAAFRADDGFFSTPGMNVIWEDDHGDQREERAVFNLHQ